MADIEFKDNRLVVKNALEDAIGKYLIEASGELVSQTARSSPVDTGQLKNSWAANIDENKMEATIGSPLENAIWNEFGTGEFALNGDGRQGGWVYKDEDGFHFTRGKAPNRTLYTAFKKLKPKLIKRAEEVLKVDMK